VWFRAREQLVAAGLPAAKVRPFLRDRNEAVRDMAAEVKTGGEKWNG
jgi:hypothetical protein